VLPTESAAYQTAAYQDEGVGSELEQLVEALPFAESLEDFASIIEGSPLEAVRDAIAFQDTQPRRIQLQGWLEALRQPVKEDVEPVGESDQGWGATIRGYAELLVEGMACGVEVVKTLLKPWTPEQRWGAMLQFEALAPEKMQELVAIAPNCFDWCDVL
jgi:hypothetical protein